MKFETYLSEHGITTGTKQFGLTLTNSEKYGEQIAFPIKDINGKFLFNKYRNLAEGQPKFVYDPGNSAQLYNSEAIKDSEYVFIFEGEPDVWKAGEDGIPAVCSTSGAGTFEKSWVELLVGKKVIICYDNDQPGVLGAEKVAEIIPGSLILKLPLGVKDYCEYRGKYTVADFQALTVALIGDNKISYAQFCEVIDKWLLLPDKNVLKILFASVISHSFTSDPLWMFLVAPPSGTKTELVTLLSALPACYMLSDLTTKTLFSGLKTGEGKPSASLLYRIPNAIIALKDFTTVLTMRTEDKQIILGQLREIYDGRYDKALGNTVEIHWKGRITLIAGVTGVIDGERALMRIMGERFIMYRILQPTDKEVAKRALGMAGQEGEMRQELQNAMRKLIWGIKIPKIAEIIFPEDILNATASLASFVVIARSGIPRSSYGTRDIEYIPGAEAPSRLAKQLAVLMKALAVFANRRIVTWEDYYLTLRVAFDAIPKNRMDSFVFLAQNEFGVGTNAIAEAIDYSNPTTLNILEDLKILGLLNRIGSFAGQTFNWEFSAKCLDYFKDFILLQDTILIKYFPISDIYRPLIDFILEKFVRKSFIEELVEEEGKKEL